VNKYEQKRNERSELVSIEDGAGEVQGFDLGAVKEARLVAGFDGASRQATASCGLLQKALASYSLLLADYG
jgi:hypothetical protein